MSDFHVTEFRSITHLSGVGEAQVLSGPLVSQHLTLTGSNQQSATVNANTKLVRVATQTACFVTVGANPNAISGVRVFMPANSVEVLAVNAGDKIAAVTA